MNKMKECFRLRLENGKSKLCGLCKRAKVCQVAESILNQIEQSREKMEVGEKLKFVIKDIGGVPLNLEWEKKEKANDSD